MARSAWRTSPSVRTLARCDTRALPARMLRMMNREGYPRVRSAMKHNARSPAKVFEEDANSAPSWWQCGMRLHIAAGLLAKEVRAGVAALNQSQAHDGSVAGLPMLMLHGFGIECVLKALWLAA